MACQILSELQKVERTMESGRDSSKILKVEFGHAIVKNLMGHSIEDRFQANVKLDRGKTIGLFGVFDGHKGVEVAEFLEQFLFDSVLLVPHFAEDPKRAIRDAYLSLDKRILNMRGETESWRSGSTATTAFLVDGGKRLVVGNVGDSRAVLSRAGKAVELTVDHDPQKPEEREMVEARGGEVSKATGGVYRVDKRLAMTRAFGDYDLKDHIIVEPDVWEEELTAKDEFFIVASDGLWHKLSSQEAVDRIRNVKDAKAAAEALVTTAVERREPDDITVIVVKFEV